MTIRLSVILIAFLLLFSTPGFGQVDSLIAQLSNSASESFAGGISGNGRFVVFESTGNVATENPRNLDGNSEIFLFDYAQRRIFQITDTKSVLFNPLADATISNVRVSILNTRPVISNDGKWIAFSSNATTSRPGSPNNTNPGFFYGDSFSSPTPTPTPTPSPTPISLATPTPSPSPSPTPTPSPTGTPTPTPTPTPAANPLASDGNLEIWLYQIPSFTDVPNLSAGDEIPFTQLAGGSFIRVTNTDPSQLPRPANSTNGTGAFVADDNHDPSISDDGSVIAFVSTRDLVPNVGNPFPAEDNDEIFTYVRTTGTLGQVTKTGRGIVSNPIYNKNPTISGNGQRVVFASTAENPIVGMTGGVNPLASRNEEIYFADLVAGSPTVATLKKQVTTTTSTTVGDPVNILDLGRRMSRDGRYIAFDSYADLTNTNSGTNYSSFATYLYDANANSFRQIGPRSDADTAASGGDVARYPGFTDTDASGAPSTLVLETRLNIKADGTVPTTASEGLNDNVVRPSQIYSFPLNVANSAATFKRLSKFPTPTNFIASTQLLPSNSIRRMAFNFALTQFGTDTSGDLQSEVYYLLQPTVATETTAATNFFTGASRLPILFTASPTPTPTGTPTPTPTATPTPSPTITPSPTPTASPTGTPTPTPTPVTPAAVLGISPGMLTILEYTGNDTPVAPKTAVGSIDRVLSLPIELNGVAVAINGVACGIKSVNGRRIEFVVPRAMASSATGNVLPIAIHNNGVVLKSWVTIVPARPDIFPKDGLVGPGGRAKAFNATNTIQTVEPFPIKTIRRHGGGLVSTVTRLYLTGVEPSVPGSSLTVIVRLRDVLVSNPKRAVLVEPGIYYIDFDMPSQLLRAGDVPIVVSVTSGGATFDSRLDDTSTIINVL